MGNGNLTKAELRVLRLLLTGATAKEIGVHLGKHFRTIELQRASLQSKLATFGPVQLGYIAAKMGIEPDNSITLDREPAKGPEQHAGRSIRRTPRGAGRTIGRDL